VTVPDDNGNPTDPRELRRATGRRRGRTALALPAVALVAQGVSPPTDVGPDELAEFWPVIVRAGWFLAAFAVVVSRVALQPTFARIVHRRNRNRLPGRPHDRVRSIT